MRIIRGRREERSNLLTPPRVFLFLLRQNFSSSCRRGQRGTTSSISIKGKLGQAGSSGTQKSAQQSRSRRRHDDVIFACCCCWHLWREKGGCKFLCSTRRKKSSVLQRASLAGSVGSMDRSSKAKREGSFGAPADLPLPHCCFKPASFRRRFLFGFGSMKRKLRKDRDVTRGRNRDRA